MPDQESKTEGQEPKNNGENNEQTQEKTFPESVVKELREEAAKNRVARRKAEEKADELSVELKDLKSKLDTIDLDELKALRTEKAQAEEAKKEAEKKALEKKGEYDKLIELAKSEAEEKVIEAQKKAQAEIEAREAKLAEAEKAIEAMRLSQRKSLIDNAIVTAASKAEAIDPEDIQLRLERIAEVQEIDGKNVVVLKGDDDEPLRDEAGKLKTVASYVEAMKSDERTAHLFKGDKKGAGSQTKPNSGGNSDNPFKTGNLTEQSRLFRENPAQAKALAKAAGIDL